MIPKPATDLMLEFEGLDQPSRWPGGSSGISLGRGYDLSAEPARDLVHDWTPSLGHDAVTRLLVACGKEGAAAEAIAHRFADIHITAPAADAVFFNATIPKYEAQTAIAFPGCRLLPDLARGALVSLIYNRGTSMTGDSRHEMAKIRDAIAHWADASDSTRAATLRILLLTISTQIRAMKRLWTGKGLDGLLRRRDAEAALIERAATEFAAAQAAPVPPANLHQTDAVSTATAPSTSAAAK